jgi:hypothetical protein
MSIIDDYKNLDDDGKCQLLQDIEFEDIPEKWQLIRSVVTDPNEYDLARVQALKILEIANVLAEEQESFGALLATVIATDQDYDVRNYAVMASKNFINDNNILKELIVAVVADPNEDIDIRHNALSAVMALWDLPRRRAVLESLLADEELGKHAARLLAEHHGSPPEEI